MASLRRVGKSSLLVHVKTALPELNWSAVSAALDSDPSFATSGVMTGDGDRLRQLSAWHACQIHHHCRTMGGGARQLVSVWAPSCR